MCGVIGFYSYGRASPGSPGPAVLLQLRLPGRQNLSRSCGEWWSLSHVVPPPSSRLVDLLSRSHWFYAARHRRGFNARSSRVWRINLNRMFGYLGRRWFQLIALHFKFNNFAYRCSKNICVDITCLYIPHFKLYGLQNNVYIICIHIQCNYNLFVTIFLSYRPLSLIWSNCNKNIDILSATDGSLSYNLHTGTLTCS